MAPAPVEPRSLPSIVDRAAPSTSEQLLRANLYRTPYAFLRPPPDLHTAALALAKGYIDPLAAWVIDRQDQRLQHNRRKRKRGQTDSFSVVQDHLLLRSKQIYLEGFDSQQVWAQAKRVLDAGLEEIQRCLPQNFLNEDDRHGLRTNNGKKAVRFMEDNDGNENGINVHVDLDEIEESLDHDMLSDEGSSEELELDQDASSGELDSAKYLDAMDDGDLEDIEEDESEALLDGDLEQAHNTSRTFTQDRNGLNDGFFSIDEFNRDTAFLEQADARGEDDGAASDEEDVDWDSNPLAQALSKNPLMSAKQGSNLAKGPSLDDDGSENAAGPTFGNADLNAPWSDDEEEDLGGEDGDTLMEDETANNANNIHYADFFAPPPRASSKPKRKRNHIRSDGDTQATPGSAIVPSDEDVQRAMASARRDIFEDDFSDASDKDAAETPSLSTHERRQATLTAQIRQLEAESIAKRQWTLSGEARAVDRPINSLLEEDLEFERTGKPVPVITAEVSNDLEALIKQRILARNFDEITRRAPGAEVLEQSRRSKRGLMELDDRKNEQSLTEIYEQEYLQRSDPNHVDKRDAKLKVAHAEIERLWIDVSGKLDALSSWHYKPKPSGVEISVVSDAPRITIEDARPSGIGMGGEESGLAPQEVYRVGTDGEKRDGEVVTKGGGVVGQAEMTREEKTRRRRRDKERMKKREAGAKETGKLESKKTQENKALVGALKQGGVKVIGKGGVLQDVAGQKVKTGSGPDKTGGVYKL